MLDKIKNIFKSKTMDKQKALERLSKLEDEAKELRKIIEAPEKKKDIFERLQTYEDCCIELNIDPQGQLPYDKPMNDVEISINAYAKLIVICKAFNEGWIPNFNDSNELKWYPWFQKNSSAFGFSGTHYDGWCTNAGAGSRLCLKSKTIAEHVGKKFEKIYNEYL